MKIRVKATVFVAEAFVDAAQAALAPLGKQLFREESGEVWMDEETYMRRVELREAPLYFPQDGPLREGTPFGRNGDDVVDSIAEAISVAEHEFWKMGTALAEAGVPYGPEDLWLEVGPVSISFHDGEPDTVIVHNERGNHALYWTRREGLGDSWGTTQQLPVRGRRIEA